MSNSIIITRNNFRSRNGLRNCVILAGGDVEIAEESVENSTVCAGGKVVIKEERRVFNSEISRNDPKALAGIRFFELADLGLSVTATEKALQVERLAKDSPLATAGLREGDVLISVGTRTPDTPEALRQALRRAVVEQSATLKVRRDGQERTITVRFPD